MACKCEYCSKSFSSDKKLELHASRRHQTPRPHRCSFCNLAFSNKKKLHDHLRSHPEAAIVSLVPIDRRKGLCLLITNDFKNQIKKKQDRLGVEYDIQRVSQTFKSLTGNDVIIKTNVDGLTYNRTNVGTSYHQMFNQMIVNLVIFPYFLGSLQHPNRFQN